MLNYRVNRLPIIFVALCAGLLSMRVAVSALVEGKLSPCNGAWNCAITQQVLGQKPDVEAISYEGSRKEAIIRLKKIIQSLERSQITNESNEYIKAKVASRLFGFVDDVEFYMPKNEKVIHIRSAAQTGMYDFGVNKNRIRTIRDQFNRDSSP